MEYVLFACYCWAAFVLTSLSLNNLINFLYASKMIFEVMRPADHDGPLDKKALQFAKKHPEVMIARRIYAIEACITSGIAGVCGAVAPALWYMTYLSWPV